MPPGHQEFTAKANSKKRLALEEGTTTRNVSSLTILLSNVRSIRNCVNELEAFLTDKNITILSLTEHWLKIQEVDSFCLNSYEVCNCTTRVSSIGGGGSLILLNKKSYCDFKPVLTINDEKCVVFLESHLICMCLVFTGHLRDVLTLFCNTWRVLCGR